MPNQLSLDREAKKALDQINRNQYALDLVQRGFFKKIVERRENYLFQEKSLEYLNVKTESKP